MGRQFAHCLSKIDINRLSIYDRSFANPVNNLEDMRLSPMIHKEPFFENPPTALKIENIKQLSTEDLIIETVVEDPSIKIDLLQELDRISPDTCVIATNTSAITLSELSSSMLNPSKLVGLHFFSPIEQMKLVEIVIGSHTSQHSILTATALAKKLGKLPILVKDSPGFYTTRILGSVLLEILDLIDDCFHPAQIDLCLRKFGFTQDISVIMDKVGLDVCLKIYKYLCTRLGQGFGVYYEDNVLKFLTDKDCLGMKTREGMNSYNFNGTKHWVSAPSYWFNVYIRKRPAYNMQHNLDPKFSDRIVYRMLNECCKCLQEGVIDSPAVGDIGAVFGCSFPYSYGGPFSYIDFISPKKVVETLEKLHEETEQLPFQPCDLLKNMVKENKRFYDRSPHPISI